MIASLHCYRGCVELHLIYANCQIVDDNIQVADILMVTIFHADSFGIMYWIEIVHELQLGSWA